MRLRRNGMADAFAMLQVRDGEPSGRHAFETDGERRPRPCRMARPADRPRQAGHENDPMDRFPGERQPQHQEIPEPDAGGKAPPCRCLQRGRGLPHSAQARQDPVPGTRQRPLDRTEAKPADHRTLRRRQDLACLRARPGGVPGREERSPPPAAAPLRRARTRPWRRRRQCRSDHWRELATSPAVPPARPDRRVRHRSRTSGDAMAHSSTTGAPTA